ncbi:ABC transporter glutamine-binding protein GlnH precursor [Microbacterium hydrocarbonoxydans]|jgi:glutamate transport system substrate-binding protein|uniref:ABC transporter glutamine-binding protein GlnH n=1 Tax=Microbacterium hydrocarbonoxydans TaxID=273678 RepID=A0A0M2HY19_9MICO|nr:glutamate ABC transporter substrate-binding protein [Microbacterium hydrocarbonoxydans]KJL49324.1 ABC transporter glutamine-binding protein GlnH precursor [Microbacterium hydrocarbonoxydans]
MRRTRTLAGIGIAAAALLALTACNSGTPTTSGDGGGGSEEPAADSTPWTIEKDVKIDGSPTFDRISSSGTVKVGVKEDQPGLGYLDPVTNERTGFDVDIARWMAASLGVDPEKIEFQAIASANREQAIVNGDIDYYVGTYSITDKRKEQISFAGPYFITGQGLLVASDSKIKSVDDLDSSTTVCSATGSTPIQNIKTNYPEVPTKEYDTYSKCVEDLKNGQVDAVTTDEAILIGYAAQDPDKIKVVGEPFSEERYGIGVAKGDTALVEYFDEQLTDGGDIWQQIFDNNLGASGVKATQPEVDPVG